MNLSSPLTPKPPTPLKILLMGREGARKTTLALQFPDPHVLDCDQNLDGPVQTLTKGIIDIATKKVLLAPIKPDLAFTWDYIRKDDNGAMLDISECYDRVCDKLVLCRTDKEYQKRKTIIVDSLSHVNEFIVRKVQKLKGKSSMEMQLWSDFASAAYTVLVAKLDQIGRTTICICHQERITESDKNDMMKKTLTEINPLFSGRVGDSLGAFFTDVWNIELEKTPTGVDCILQTQRTPKCRILKNSLGMPAELKINNGFKDIEPYLKGRIV